MKLLGDLYLTSFLCFIGLLQSAVPVEMASTTRIQGEIDIRGNGMAEFKWKDVALGRAMWVLLEPSSEEMSDDGACPMPP